MLRRVRRAGIIGLGFNHLTIWCITPSSAPPPAPDVRIWLTCGCRWTLAIRCCARFTSFGLGLIHEFRNFENQVSAHPRLNFAIPVTLLGPIFSFVESASPRTASVPHGYSTQSQHTVTALSGLQHRLDEENTKGTIQVTITFRYHILTRVASVDSHNTASCYSP